MDNSHGSLLSQLNYTSFKILLQPGIVFYIKVEEKNPPDMKYIIVLGVDIKRETFACVFINSDVNGFCVTEEEGAETQILITPSELNHLKWESYIHCGYLHERSIQALHQAILERPSGCHRGSISEKKLTEIYSKASQAKTVKPYLIKRYFPSQFHP